MKKDMTELVFILDRSGSMGGLETDTIGGFNSMLKKQKKEKGHVVVTTVLFDDRYELLHDRINIKGVDKMTEEDYFVRGSTALLDAVGRTIGKINQVQNKTSVKAKADKVMFVIITDGLENASHEFTAPGIKKLITKCQKKQGWEFIFLGANIDAVKTAATYGIAEERAANYHADSAGTALNFQVVNAAVADFRKGKKLDRSWKEEVEVDFLKRKS